MLRPLIIRADANAQIGTGHFMRSLALAQAWQDAGGKALFVLARKTLPLESRLLSEGLEVSHLEVEPGSDQDAFRTADLADRLNGRTAWVSVDGPHFGADYQRTIKDRGVRLLVLDDCGSAKHYCADIVLNQNLHANKHLYRDKEPHTVLLLGTRYVLLRREFLKRKNRRKRIPAVARKVLVTLGGADRGNQTLRALQALDRLSFNGLKIVVTVGANNPHLPLLEKAVNNRGAPVRLVKDAHNMAQLMVWADVAISSGGTTVWEMAFMGLPAVVLATSPIETFLVGGLKKNDLFSTLRPSPRWLGKTFIKTLSACLTDKKGRAETSLRGQSMVDGLGCRRVLKVMNE